MANAGHKLKEATIFELPGIVKFSGRLGSDGDISKVTVDVDQM
jgi:hypothetical protein